MSWNGSGVYSLPALYFPEAPGNLVDSVRYNGTLNDISTGLNVALTKNGQNAATANLPMGGFKHTGAVAASTSGEYLLFGQSSASLGLALGTSAAPSLFITGDTNTGIYSEGADSLDFTAGGVRSLSVKDTKVVALTYIEASAGIEISAGSLGDPSFSFSAEPTTGIYRSGAGAMDFAVLGVRSFVVANTKSVALTPIELATGSAAAPSLNFSSSTDSGLFYAGSDEIGVACNGAEVAKFTPEGLVQAVRPFRASSSATSSAGTNEATTYTEVFDPAGAFNAATGRYTAPVAGYYHFDFVVQSNNGGGYVNGALRVNGAAIDVWATAISGSSLNVRTGAGATVLLAASDIVSIYTTVGGGLATLVESFSGHLVSAT